MKIINNITLVSIIFISACAPSYSVWLSSTNGFVGTNLNSHLLPPACRPDCLNSYWSPINHNNSFDKVIDEGAKKRYYITWVKNCRYSILVDSSEVIESWRYESENTESCYVF